MEYMAILIGVSALFVFLMIVAPIRRYKRCPSDRVMVVFGKIGSGPDGHRSAKCIHGGAAFIWPVIQDYSFMDLTPISIEVNLTSALSRQNIRVDVPSRFTVAISTESGVMENAAERLLGLAGQEIHDLAKDIIFGQLRLVVATMDIEEINNNRDKFLSNVSANVEAELKKIGLKLINVNVTDIKDESGYIEALGKEAAAKAINEAKKSVAEQEKLGETGKAEAEKEKDVQIAETIKSRDSQIANTMKDKEVLIAIANRDESIGKALAAQETRIKTAEANASAVQGENLAKITIANSDAERREREAEALKRALAAEKVQSAQALQEAYMAEKLAEEARAQREKAAQTASIVVNAEILKEKLIIEAQAEAERIRQQAKGTADAIFMKMDAEARGTYEILTKQAEGMDRIVKAAGNSSRDAVLLLIADKLPEIVRLQTEAIRNIKIDKINVWDNGQGAGDGKTSTAGFISGLYKSVPPLQDMLNMAGLTLPDYLAKKDEPHKEIPPKTAPDAKKPDVE
ncbi:MAG TPA: SPFH domain-containing protein [Bacteroidales bacterium]|nr:SPFH domain-containing protein [Bacteroidales bacterium]